MAMEEGAMPRRTVDLAWRGGRSSSVPASLDCPMLAEAPSTSAPSMRSSLGDLACPPPTSTRRGRRTPAPPAPGDGEFLSSFLPDGTTVVAILSPAAMCNAYRRIIEFCPPQVWNPEILLKLLYLSKPYGKLTECIWLAVEKDGQSSTSVDDRGD
ncbi:uncharacterized protein LOC124675002 [Lolium rigidum]|uniref:uncharacterized protein LOC124675002 n=1 Tax=Lolium rigidum TaxID=89674 RepID=UPI001F5DBD83|nr:uncharacterized protein LOC124675002 [Lolium rigidum]